MKRLLHKELRLTAAPVTYYFLAFALMTLIPGSVFFTPSKQHGRAVIFCTRRCCPAKSVMWLPLNMRFVF